MNLYRFSPIETEAQLREALAYVHTESYRLCQQVLGISLPNAGNMAIFSHYQSEYDNLLRIRDTMIDPSQHWNQKYFKLANPITFPETTTGPETIYEYLYVRKPDPYRFQVGDIDLYLNEFEYQTIKQSVQKGEYPGARIFPEDRLDMLELHDPDSDVLVYVSTKKMGDLVSL